LVRRKDQRRQRETLAASRMAAAEKFCLRWNDFESNISVAFRELREEKDFFDVTLACEDSQISAHKVILSACSPFFRSVLRKNPHQHPLLYLKGVKLTELHAVLNFMYQGEVNVAQEELNSFLAVAEELRVKGLTQNTQETPKQRSSPPRDPVPPPKRPRPAPPPPTRTQPQVFRSQEQRDDEVQEVQEVQTVKAEPREQQVYQENQESAVAIEDTYQEDYGDYGQYEGQYEDIDPNTGLPLADGNKATLALVATKMYETMDETGLRLWQCGECDYARHKKDHVNKHVEQKHSGLQFVCEYCQAVFHRRDTYRDHVKKKHTLIE